MHISFTTLVESKDRYTLVKEAPILGYFIAFLFVVFLPPFSVILIMNSVIKGGIFISVHMVSSWLTRVSACIFHLSKKPTRTISVQF